MTRVGAVLLLGYGLAACELGQRTTMNPVEAVQNLDDIRALSPAKRVAEARRIKVESLKRAAKSSGLSFPVKSVYFRAFKQEKRFEVWGADTPGDPHRLLKTYAIAAQSGGLGPKRKEGDRQVPEGLYRIARFNPASSYLLSLGLDYPNASDRVLSDSEQPGSDIFVHGDQVSIGCLALTDDKILEVYLWAWLAHESGQKGIRVDIFPFPMTRQNLSAQEDSAHFALWSSLSPAFSSFQASRKVPAFTVDETGLYRVKG